MTIPQIEDSLLCRPTESLVLPSQRKFYPIKIPNWHHQLRHYISTAEPDIIYFATGYDIYSLQLSTRQQELIATLPFIPRCLSADFGWICVGGSDNGDCAFVKMGEKDGRQRQGPQTAAQADVDALLPLDLDPSSRRNTPWNPNEIRPDSTLNPKRRPEVYIHELGGLIVNSVTVHRMHHKISEPADEIIDEDVVTLTNNDTTVKIYSLTQQRVLDTLHHSVCMNYAVMSPDSTKLVAVGDENRAYFYLRVRMPDNDAKFNEKKLPGWKWILAANPVLPIDSLSDDGYCFTTTFSPSGHLCAVASQAGIITVFDMDLLEMDSLEADGEVDGAEAIFCNFRSARFNSRSTWGAVRSMAFSPEPWDLLVWAEDHGRAGIADVRQAFTRRQILELDVHALDLDHVKIEDITDPVLKDLDPEARFIRQYRDAVNMQDNAAVVNHLVDYMEASASRRRLRHQARAQGQEEPSRGLTERERQVLNAIGVSRRGINDIASEVRSYSPYSVNYLPPGSRRSTADDSTTESTSSLRAHPPNPRHLDTIREYIRERNLERNRNRSGDRFFQPRRRGSVVLSQGNSSSSLSSSNLIPRNSGPSRWTASPSRLPSSDPPSAAPTSANPNNSTSASTSVNNNADPWQTIEDALQSSPRPTRLDPALDQSPDQLPRPSLRERDERDLSALVAASEPTFGYLIEHAELQPEDDPPEGEPSRPLREVLAEDRIRREREAAIEANFERREREHHARVLQQERLRDASIRDRLREEGRGMTYADARPIHLVRSLMEREMERERDFEAMGMPALRRQGVHGHDDRGVGTAGVGWSADGRRLYIGTEEGILEYQVNIRDRMSFPGLSVR